MADDPAVPAPARLLRDFANTLDLDTSTDALASPEQLAGWLREHGLLTADEGAGEQDLETARRLREGLRAALAAHHDAEATVPDLDRAAEQLPLRLVTTLEGPRLRPVATAGAPAALAELAVALAEAAADASWRRLKICPADDCRWAFYDASKNRARTWCSMQICGNREKTRSYRQRHASG